VFLPIHTLWWTVFGVPITGGLSWFYHLFVAVPILASIGAYGVAIIAVTLIIKVILSPLYEFQLRTSKKNLQNQRKLAPQMAEIKKKYKGDPQKQQQATMALYREHGINPLANLSGCLPSFLQFPILDALYFSIRDNVKIAAAHFLFIPDLNAIPHSHLLLGPIPDPIYLIIPLLAAASTFVQSRMMQQPMSPVATEQEQQSQQMMKSMQVIMPLMIFVFAIQVPVALGLYWCVSNCFAIIQQYRVNGWGGLLGRQTLQQPASLTAAPVAATATVPSSNGSRTPSGRVRREPPVTAKRKPPAKRTRKSTR
jgi:YidC/Oxa1 family membrane protein insertase